MKFDVIKIKCTFCAEYYEYMDSNKFVWVLKYIYSIVKELYQYT